MKCLIATLRLRGSIAGAKFIYVGTVQKNESISATVYSTRSNVRLTKTWPKQFNGSFDAPGWATGDAVVGAEISSQAVSGSGAQNYTVKYHELPSDLHGTYGATSS